MNFKKITRIIACFLTLTLVAQASAGIIALVTVPFNMIQLAHKKKRGEEITFFDVAGLVMPFGGLAMGKVFSPFGMVKDTLSFGGHLAKSRVHMSAPRKKIRHMRKRSSFRLPIPFFA